VQKTLDLTFDPIRSAIPYPNFWSLPNYLLCLAGHVNCSELSQSDLNQRQEDMKICWPHRQKILHCFDPERSSAGVDNYDENCIANLPDVCQTKYYRDMFYFILPQNFLNPDGTGHQRPVFINTILPILQLPAYEHQQTPNVTFGKFKKIYRDILSLDMDTKLVKFRGLNLGIKMALYGDYLVGDSKFVVLAACLACFLCLAYSGSIFYGASVAFSLVFSLGISFFLYSLVFQIHFFPFINLLVIVLLVGIGADNTFVLKHIFDNSLLENPKENKEETTDVNLGRNLQKSVKNAAKSMFITNATTAAAFYANYVSDVIVMKCFGIFAGTTMMVNYFLIVSFLPASLITMEKYIRPNMPKFLQLKNWRQKMARVSEKISLRILYIVIDRLKLLWLLTFTVLFLASAFVVFYKPGLKLPEKNPILLFKKDNPMEWYDEYVSDYFDIGNSNLNDPIVVELVWGIKVDPRSHHLVPANHYAHRAHMIQDRKFSLDFAKLKILGQFWQELASNSSFVRWKNQHRSSFYDQYLEWSLNQTCGSRSILCCNYLAGSYKPDSFNACLLQASRDLDVLNEGPIFDSFHLGANLPGYLMRFTTRYNYSLMYKNLHEFYTTVDEMFQQTIKNHDQKGLLDSDSWWITENYFTLLWYDLQKCLLQGTPVSIAVSVVLALVVVILSTRTIVLSILSILTISGVMVTTIAALVMLDWRLNIVESTIIILTAGLSFDFTLLYAAAYKLCQGVTREERVISALKFISLPVLLSALTTCVAGACMLPAVTMAYFQIGVFMVVVTLVSLLASTLYFLSLLLVFGSATGQTTKCEDIDLC